MFTLNLGTASIPASPPLPSSPPRYISQRAEQEKLRGKLFLAPSSPLSIFSIEYIDEYNRAS